MKQQNIAVTEKANLNDTVYFKPNLDFFKSRFPYFKGSLHNILDYTVANKTLLMTS